MYPAIDEHDLELHLVHTRDGSRIGYQKICKEEGEPVPDDGIAKGYEVDGELVVLEAEDFEAAESEAHKTIEILSFVPQDEIDPIYFERSFYLGPQEGSEKVYALLVEAMQRAGLVGVVRYVFHDREQLGALRVRDGVLVVARMHFADEIRPLDDLLPDRRPDVDPRELEMALELVERFSGSFDPNEYEDRYRARLLEIVERKRAGGEVRAAPSEEPERTPDLLAALQESLERHSRSRPSTNGKPRAKTGQRADRADVLTVDELAGRARELGIAGRSRMNKRELVAAIRNAERRT
jgi:DNA end-binding protein Ku